MEFYIRQNATLPYLKVKVFKDGRNNYKEFSDSLTASTITFSMYDEETQVYKILDRPASIMSTDTIPAEYYVYYQFRKTDSKKSGRYIGEFKITNSQGTIILPLRETLFVNVLESFADSDTCCRPNRGDVPVVFPTETPRNTVTPTLSLSTTPTPTVTPSNSPTPSVTPTYTPTGTNTPTPTPTYTPTGTNTPTPTPTNAYYNYNWELGGLVSCCDGSNVPTGLLSSDSILTSGDIISINLDGDIKCYELINIPTLFNQGSPLGPIVINTYSDCDACKSVYGCDSPTPTPTHTPTSTITPTPSSLPITPNLYYDAGNSSSYPGTGTALYNIGSDGSASGTQGTLSGVVYESGIASGVFNFDGGSDRITFPSYDFGDQITVTAWVYPRYEPSINTLLANATANSFTDGFKLHWNSWNTTNYRILVEAGNGGTGGAYATTNTNVVVANQWQQLTYVIDFTNQTISLYRNGTLLSGTGSLVANVNTSATWNIGSMMGAYYMDANLGELKVFKSLLSSTDISDEYNNSKTRYGL